MRPKNLTLTLLVLMFSPIAHAQVADGSAVLLPLEAQTCRLPSAPARVTPDADYEALSVGKERITQFQQDLEAYRACLDKSRSNERLTDGNRVALDRAHDYSVEMETRIAEQFNVAVRAYRAREQEK